MEPHRPPHGRLGDKPARSREEGLMLPSRLGTARFTQGLSTNILGTESWILNIKAQSLSALRGIPRTGGTTSEG